MSLILDAINRSREDVTPVPGLATHHPVDRVGVNRRQYLLWVALSIAIVVIAWLIVERYSAPRALEPDIPAAVVLQSEVASPAPVAEPIESASAQVLETQPVATPELSSAATDTPVAPAVAEETGAHTAPQTGLSGADAGGTPAATVTEVITPAPLVPAEPVDDDAIAQLYANPQPAEEPVMEQRTARRTEPAGSTREEPELDVDRLLRLAQEESKNANLDKHPVAFLIDLSQQVKDSIPSLYYLRHDYSSNPAVSTVVLNSKTLRVGDSPAAGMKVEEILPDSVVLNYQGTQFRLRALNSWINL